MRYRLIFTLHTLNISRGTKRDLFAYSAEEIWHCSSFRINILFSVSTEFQPIIVQIENTAKLHMKEVTRLKFLKKINNSGSFKNISQRNVNESLVHVRKLIM